MGHARPRAERSAGLVDEQIKGRVPYSRAAPALLPLSSLSCALHLYEFFLPPIMISKLFLTLALATGALAQASVSPIAQKIADLRDAPTQVDRIKLLDKDSDVSAPTISYTDASAD